VTVVLNDRTQSAVRRLLVAEPEAGSLLSDGAMRALGQLVGCDGFGVFEADDTGLCLRQATFPSLDPGDPQVCDGPLPTGLIHDAEEPPDERDAREFGMSDLIRLGFSTRHGTVVQVAFVRRRSMFTAHEVALLAMVEPALGRLLRSCAGREAPATLTASERQVLTLVAGGASNREVAEELFVTVHTVRKHLENAYRKLGVTNRTAAALHIRARS
jgi:DNA-binding CsgD family transcriptional regulator